LAERGDVRVMADGQSDRFKFKFKFLLKMTKAKSLPILLQASIGAYSQ